MNALPPPSAQSFVTALRRYVGALEYRPGKTCVVVETPNGPKGFCDCAGLPLIALRDLGVLPSCLDLNFPLASNREREILRVLHRVGRLTPKNGELQAGDVLVTGARGQYHVMTMSGLGPPRIIEVGRAHSLVCERALGKHEIEGIRSMFRLF